MQGSLQDLHGIMQRTEEAMLAVIPCDNADTYFIRGHSSTSCGEQSFETPLPSLLKQASDAAHAQQVALQARRKAQRGLHDTVERCI